MKKGSETIVTISLTHRNGFITLQQMPDMARNLFSLIVDRDTILTLLNPDTIAKIGHFWLTLCGTARL